MIHNIYIYDYIIIYEYVLLSLLSYSYSLTKPEKMPLRDDLRLLCSPPARCFEVYRIGLGPHRGLL